MKKLLQQKKQRPVEIVVEKGQQIAIYHTPDSKAGKVYDSYTVVFIRAGKRVRKRASNLELARKIATSVARQLGEGVGHIATLSKRAEITVAFMEK